MEGGNFTAETAFDEDGGSVSRSDEQPSNYGAHSPRPARSQISTAVSFEPASERPANSAAIAARSGEDSALSAAEPEGELSSLPQEVLQGTAEHEGPLLQEQQRRAYPSGSLLSTAERPLQQQPQHQHQPAQPQAAQHPPSPPANRANSVVSKTPREANRAGTPASVYGQGRSLGRQLRADSPFGYEQNSTAAPVRGQQEASERLQGPPEPEQQPQKSEWREAPVMHLDGAASQPPAGHMMQPAGQLHGTSQDDMQEGYMSGTGHNNSIEAMQQGEARPVEDAAGASAGLATFASSPGQHPGQAWPRMPAAAHTQNRHHSFAAGRGAHLERSASAGSKSERGHRDGHRRAWPNGPAHSHLAHDAHMHYSTLEAGAQPSPAQQSGIAGERALHHPGSRLTTDEPQLAEALGQLPPPPPPVFMAPALPAASPLFGMGAGPHAALLNVQGLLRVLDNNGNMFQQHGAGLQPLAALSRQPSAAAAAQGRAVQIEPLLRQLSQHLSTSWQSRAAPTDMEHAGSARLGGDQGDNMDAEQGGGSNSAAEQYLSGESFERTVRTRASAGAPPQAHNQGADMANMLQTAGSLQRPAEGQLVDPHMQEQREPVSRSPSGEARWPRQRASAQEATLGQAASWGFARSVQQQADAEQSVQEANSLPAPGAHHGHMLAGAFSGAVPALSIIQGQLEPFRPAVDGPSSEGGNQGEGRSQPLTGSGRLSPHLLGRQLDNAGSVGPEDIGDFNGALPAQNSAMMPREGEPDERGGQLADSNVQSVGDLGGNGENCASYVALPPPTQEAMEDLYQQRPDTAHAAASVHATVMSEEDVQSEGETNLSSMRGRPQRSAPVRTGHAQGHAARPQHHSAGSPPMAYADHRPAEVPGDEDTPRPLDSTTGMAAAPAPAASGGQSVEMCTHGSGSAWAGAPEPSNSTGSFPGRPVQSRRRRASLGAGQGATSAAEGLGRAFSSSAHASAGHRGRQHPPGDLPADQAQGVLGACGAEVPAPGDLDGGAQDQVEDNIGGGTPMMSNGTTVGQLLAAGPQSVLTTAGQAEEPEGSLASRHGMEQQGEVGLPDASPSVGTAGRAAPDAAVRIAAAASAAAAAASAKLGTLLVGVAPPAPMSHLRGASSYAEARPAVPHFQAARSHGHQREAGAEEPAQGAGEVAQPQIARTCSSSLLPHRSRSGVGYEGSAEPLDGQPHARRAASQHTNGLGQDYSTAAATSPKATSEDEPAQATFTAGAHSVGGSPTAELEMQSHPSPYTPPHHAAPQPAVAVVMPSGCLPHVSEGKGESHPAASGAERAASEARPNGSAHHPSSNGHGGAHAPQSRPSRHADVLSGEDSAPDDGPAVTSPATGSTPGRRRSMVGKRKRVGGQQPTRGRFSAASTS